MRSVLFAYVTLALAIIFEVAATSLLMKSAQFTKIVPTLFMVLFYAVSFYLLSLTLKTIPIGIAYAIWGGVGIVLTALVGVFFFQQKIDAAAVIGICLIIAGVVVINVFSSSAAH